jgi:hypothetical protein
VKKAWRDGMVIVGRGATNAYVTEELLGIEINPKEACAPDISPRQDQLQPLPHPLHLLRVPIRAAVVKTRIQTSKSSSSSPVSLLQGGQRP